MFSPKTPSDPATTPEDATDAKTIQTFKDSDVAQGPVGVLVAAHTVTLAENDIDLKHQPISGAEEFGAMVRQKLDGLLVDKAKDKAKDVFGLSSGE